MENKTCLYCDVEFTPKRKCGKTQKYCCHNHAHQHWRKLNPEKNKAQSQRDNLSKKTDPIKKKNLRVWLVKYMDKPERRFAHYISGAKTRNYSFELSYEQFMEFWQKPCHYCGSEIRTVGIDRVDNTVGYNINNCAPCCETCNKIKKTLSVEEFTTQCTKIANHMATIEA